MASAVVFATGNGNGNGNGKGKDNGNGKGKDNGKGNSNVNANSNWHGNERNAGDNKGDIRKGTSDASSTSDANGKDKTDVVHEIVSTPDAVQGPVMALLITYPAVAVESSDGPAWWSVVKWNAETLFRKFFFISGSIGEKIRRKNVLRNRKRREIYNFVVNFPFSHFRRITRMVGVGPNEGSWHLRILEKMGLVKSEYFGRYLIYHANNSGHNDSRGNRPASLIQNSNATKIREYLSRNQGVKITHVARALMMNRNTVSYHIKRMQTRGLVERVERNGLRLARTGDDHGEGLAHVIANPMASNNLTVLR
jgi:DNA-binding transcriptional ArsR family regulator